MLEYTTMLDGLQDGKTRWAHYSIAYHFVWIPKYRKPILTGEVQKGFKDIVTATCLKHGIALLAMETDENHVHVFVSAPPRFSPANLVNLLKGNTSRGLRKRFKWLRKKVGRNTLWTQTYYVGTAGHVSTEVIRRYILECQGQ